ncbi:hypothetical protein Hypma_009271 [Hypsizygus marmoreus]|uniref:Glycosyltransferase 61 catalytic domain-containing protein n=1 Tax=Hypsizygus marmoreus TaxID=39966 RepID=A0A369JMV7_HYPMA|nr:hypothetical protein Hypma_009271 [Hypsizygus marmoreus]
MIFRHTLSRRDAILVLIGASVMHMWSIFMRQPVIDQSIIIGAQYPNIAHPSSNVDTQSLPHEQHRHHTAEPGVMNIAATTRVIIETRIQTETTTVVREASPLPTNTPTPLTSDVQSVVDTGKELPHTSIVSHAPGWTLFRNLYMSNGTLYILSSNRSFPVIRMMASVALFALNTPENIAAREPTPHTMDYITPEEALKRWGGNPDRGEKNRVWTIEGNTLLFNDPRQFLRHYYHFVAELFFGAWSFWHGAWSPPSTAPSTAYALSHPAPPTIHRAIFAHSNADGWRDDPGFNAYFLRAAFPSLTVEVQEDWTDRVALTADTTRAWHFPIVLLADRSAAHRGPICGSQTQRTASEAWEYMKQSNKLMGDRVGGWWEPVRQSIWRFAGVDAGVTGKQVVPAAQVAGDTKQNELALPMPDKVVITYISRQGVARRKLIQEDHDGLVVALKELAKRKGDSWELVILHAEKMTKDEQVKAAARTTILLGVHGNGLTHLVFMKPTRASAVIELFYPGGFAHDYHWTSRALGMDHYAVWNDKYFTHPNEPNVDYPEGFQGNYIPVHGPTVAKLIEDHVERKRSA